MKITYDVSPPFAIQLSITEGCSLACSFCGIQSIRDNGANAELGIHGKNSAPYKFMELSTVERVVTEVTRLGWNPRWELAGHGEPSMHPQLAEIVNIIREQCGKKSYIMMTANGSGFLKDAAKKIEKLFFNGLNTLGLDDYKHAGGWVDKILAQLDDYYDDPINGKPRPFSFHRYPDDPKGSLHARQLKPRLVVVNDISENITGNHQLTNQGGNSFASQSLTARCAKPFRELTIRADGGHVSLCCDDWKGAYKIGNVADTPLDDIWYHPRFEAARRRLVLADRAFGPCKGCNVVSKRVGLLPDKLGRATMPLPNDESNEHIKAALRGKVFTIKPVKVAA